MLELRNLPQMIYVAVRAVGPYQQTAGPAFDRLMGWAGPEGLAHAGAAFLGLSWDQPGRVPDERLRYDAAVTIEEPVAVPDGFHRGALPAMTWAMATHRGAYGGISATFGELMREMAARTDLVPVGLCAIEIYRSGPGTAEADLVTDLGLPAIVFD